MDDYGNSLWSKIVTTGHGQTHTKTITSQYYPADETNWLINQLKNISVEHKFEGTSSHVNNNGITRESSFSYYPTGQLHTETIAPNASDLSQKKTTSYEYDTYGLKDTITQQGWRKDGTAITRQSTIARSYDTKNGHPSIKTITTNGLNERETRWTSSLHGNQIAHKDANNQETTASYDALGRKISDTNALNVTTHINYQWVEDKQAHAVYSITQNTEGLFDYQSTYFDTLNREVLSKTKSLDGRDVINATLYNAKGQKESINRPYLAYTNAVWVCYTYDKFGRITQTNSPGAMDGSPNCDGGNRATKNIVYDELKTTTTDALGHVTVEQHNIIGQISRIDEADGTSDHSWLNYTYDDMGDLKTVTDANNKVTQLNYDNNGRKTTMIDPAMGTWQYQYNSFDELEKQTDAKGQTVSLNYDTLGRMPQRNDGEGQWNWNYASVNSVYPSGQSIDLGVTPVGYLRSVTGPSYQKTMSYNAALQVKSSTQTQVLPDSSTQTLSQSYTYDNYGRVASNTKPEGFVVQNEYNRYGHLVAIKSPEHSISAQAQAKITAQKQLAQQKANKAEALAKTYLDQAYNYQVKAIEYETYARSIIQTKAYSANVFTGKIAFYQAANELRDISVELIKQANTLYSDARAQTLSAAGTSTDTGASHRVIAKTHAKEAIQKLEQAKTIVQKYKTGISAGWWISVSYTGANSMLQLAENMMNSAQTSYVNFQDQLSLAERYQNYASGLNADLANSNATTWWRAQSADAEGRITSAIYGNGTTTERTYDANNGQLLNILTRDGVQTLQNLSYQYDHLNNVKERTDNVLNYTDSYNYDNLERLTLATLNVVGHGSVSKAWAFDKIGNIDTIDGVNGNDYSYDDAGKLTSTSEQGNYSYDANGNQKTGAGRNIIWSSFNKPISLAKGLSKVEFTYNADHSRMLKVKKHSNILESTTQYFGGYEKTTQSNGDIEHKYHIAVGTSVIAIKSVKTDSAGLPLQAQKVNYLHKDALGSVDLITNDSGGIVERLGYTPFGTRRDLNALQTLNSYASLKLPYFDPAITKRGFTGHEHIDELNLIHMNGRVYDPETGRFLSADPLVQAPYRTQSYNRYAYVMNNPLKYTDPSGFEWDDPDGFGASLGYDGGYTNAEEANATENGGNPYDSNESGVSDWRENGYENHGDWIDNGMGAEISYDIPLGISYYERQLAKRSTQKSRVDFWENRYAKGDPFAYAALDVVNYSSIPGIVANIGSPFKNQQLGLALMVDYVDWIDKDYFDLNKNNIRGMLSRDQIDDWHNTTFGSIAWSGIYGGNIFDFISDRIICGVSCDEYNP